MSCLVRVFRYKADQAFLVGQDKSPVGAYLDVEVRRMRMRGGHRRPGSGLAVSEGSLLSCRKVGNGVF